MSNLAPSPAVIGSADLKIAACYIRVSTDDQVEYSPDAQLVELKKYAAAHGYLIPPQYVFVDEGISGRNTAKRDQFNNMIGVAKTKPKPFDAILLWKYSRFARSREDSVVYKSMLRKQLGIDVISISEPVGDDKMALIIEAMIEAMDEYYSINLAEEVRRGMSEKARRGGLQSTPSFGYTVENNVLVPVPEEAAIVRELFRRYLGGEGCFPLAKWVNSLGITTHRGSKFENRTVEYILRNPVYIGKLRWNPTGRTRRDFDNENIILADAQHEPLVSVEDWDTAQTLIKQQKARAPYKGRPGTEKRTWLSGLIRCAACGNSLVSVSGGYYRCGGYTRGLCKHTQFTKDHLLMEAIIAQLTHDATHTAHINCNIIHQTDDNAPELTALERSLFGLARKRERLREAFLGGADTVEEYREAKEMLAREESAIRSRIEELKKQDAKIDTTALLRQRLTDCVAVLQSDSTTSQKFDVANKIIEKCTYSKANSTISITYRLVF